MATLTLESLNKSIDGSVILKDINLHVEDGEFLVVVGPSGCGKSTLLRLISGLEPLSGGRILLNGECLEPIAPSKRNIAMVFQHYALYPHMTVYNNMAYGLKLRGVSKSQIDLKVTQVAKTLQLTDCLNRLPAGLSGGQRQRVAMGRAIVREPSLFLFDEPLSNLDAQLRQELRHEIKKQHQSLKTTSVYVTHDHLEAMTMATRMVVLNEGQIEQVGTPYEIYQSPASVFVAQFIGQYPINLFNAQSDYAKQSFLTSAGFRIPMPQDLCIKTLPNDVIIGIRPEHLKPSSDEACHVKAVVSCIDMLGADKLIELSLGDERRLLVRLAADFAIGSDLALRLSLPQAHIFCKHSGKRLGGWSESEEQSITAH